MKITIKYWPYQDPNDTNEIELDVSSEFTPEDYMEDTSDNLSVVLAVLEEIGYGLSIVDNDDADDDLTLEMVN